MGRHQALALRALFALACLPFFVGAVGACAAEEVGSSGELASASLDDTLDERSSGGDPAGDDPLLTECPEGRWCSELYPPTWSAEDPADGEGRFLHDFSYAGYRYGEEPPTSPPGAVHDVVAAHGADPTGQADATASIQSAIDAAAAAGGGVVFLPEGTYALSGVLTVGASGVVLRGVGEGSVLRFTKSRGMANRAHLTFAGAVQREAPRVLAADAPARARELFVADANGLAPGDDVAIGWTISPAFVAEHEMTGTWKAFNGRHVPFFRSTIVAVDTTASPHRIELDVPLRYAAKLRDGAAIEKETGHLREVGVEALGITNATAWEDAWAEDRVNAITLRDVKDAWVADVHSVPDPSATGLSPADERVYHLRSGGVMIENAKRVSVLRSSMENPQNRGSGGNGYLFEVSRTSEVLVAESTARNGRHNFIQNWGFGNAGTVFLRCASSGSELLSLIRGELVPELALSEHHHSLAMATLVDDSRIDDGFGSVNRGAWSDGAGHTATESVVWRASGKGKVLSKQHGWGYVIGTHAGVEIDTDVTAPDGEATFPEDFVEGAGEGDALYPASLYDNQRARRLAQRP
jgi:hypothetical protein